MKKIYLLFMLLIMLNIASDAEVSDSTSVNRIRTFGYLGIAAGHESFVSLFFPKIGLMATRPLGNRSDLSGTPKYALYAAADVSLFAVVVPFVSGSFYSGIKVGPCTIDAAYSFMNGLSSGGTTNSPHYQSFNPKFGIHLNGVWFKFGPSFETRNHGGDGLADWIRIGKNLYNFDLNFVFEF